MSASASSVALFALAPSTVAAFVSKPKTVSFIPLSISRKLLPKPISFTLSAASGKCFDSLPSRLVRNVAVSSDFELDGGVTSDEGEPSFSPDLKLFVGNLPFSVDSAQLAALFEGAGNVEMVEVIYDKVTGRSRGFGFVTMSTPEEVEAAAQQFNGYELEGRALRVNSGPPPPRREGSFPRPSRSSPSYASANRVYVGNLAWAVDDLALETLFGEQGKVVEARVIYDRESGRSKGFGFVTYSSAEEVNNAIESLNGVDLDGRQIRVSLAESRPPRRAF